MPRSITSAGTERPFLGLLLIVELIVAVMLVGRPDTSAPEPAPVSPPAATAVASRTETMSDGRTVELMSLGGPTTQPLLDRVSGAMDDAVRAVTGFWGPDWRRDIVVVATASDEQFRALAGGGSDIAAATTDGRIVFAPGAAAMSDAALRIVLRHELFHYAARADTAADALRWLTEGVADFVARPATPLPGQAQAAEIAVLPSDADLDTAGSTRTLAYDRAWWFTRFVADRYGTSTLRRLYVRACGPGHPGVEAAVSETLGTDLDEVLVAWRRWLSQIA
ncbi:peptidase [Mycolicibacterium stellerae]|uniref:peptidase n=1 Tax=Mycolicibacterium stellerae TaxID=2358193 RepID=UPI000F0B9FD8|nr:peptidase [Mycolicibacterium stellerae]